jgi:hypothetical protein
MIFNQRRSHRGGGTHWAHVPATSNYNTEGIERIFGVDVSSLSKQSREPSVETLTDTREAKVVATRGNMTVGDHTKADGAAGERTCNNARSIDMR